MIVKSFIPSGNVDLLQSLADAAPSKRKAIQKQLRIVAAGESGERQAAYDIDFWFRDNAEWAVIHGLRIEHAGRTAQIDHILVGRCLEFVVLETKHFASGLKITDEGEFLRWNDWSKKYEGMASPIAQNRNHVAVLEDALAAGELIPAELQKLLPPSIRSYVLVNPKARIDRTEKFDTSPVVKSDQFLDRLFADAPDARIFEPRKGLSPSDLQRMAIRVAAADRPMRIDYGAMFGVRHSDVHVVVPPLGRPLPSEASVSAFKAEVVVPEVVSRSHPGISRRQCIMADATCSFCGSRDLTFRNNRVVKERHLLCHSCRLYTMLEDHKDRDIFTSGDLHFMIAAEDNKRQLLFIDSPLQKTPRS